MGAGLSNMVCRLLSVATRVTKYFESKGPYCLAKSANYLLNSAKNATQKGPAMHKWPEKVPKSFKKRLNRATLAHLVTLVSASCLEWSNNDRPVFCWRTRSTDDQADGRFVAFKTRPGDGFTKKLPINRKFTNVRYPLKRVRACLEHSVDIWQQIQLQIN